ncbi:hypothetical protein K0T92_06130 [Paenibacillus oenotherae]|uniref:Uncharacterized protein n=1 Tax=Paenibacillus oenotherae TaxID=1435645 RepID=A0ABS7D355_9BACL|nr:hypothetical protein [Paenibacillus oenotherae]MBW7474315.1 hypothetical protein [Paenibacillus oenotherae]
MKSDIQLQKEYDFRQKLISDIEGRIQSFISSYCLKYKSNIGFMLVYPLIRLEERCFELNQGGNLSWIEDERYAISWFIRQIAKFSVSQNQSYEFNNTEYQLFKNVYPQIKDIWDDYQYIIRLNDMNSYGKYDIDMNSDVIQIIRPAIMHTMIDSAIYGNGLHDREGMAKDKIAAEKVSRYLQTRDLQQLRKIALGKDKDFIELCITRVDKDFSKMGGNITSAYIENLSNLRRFIGFLYSICQFQLFSKFNRIPGIGIKKDSLVFSYTQSEFIEITYKAIRIPIEQLKLFIEYFTFPTDNEGTLQEFPLILHNEKIYFIPSSFLLNDWHFNIPNGHYYKKIEITNRNNTIAHTIVQWVADRAEKFPNIVISMEKDYQKVAHQQSLDGSEIDLALYDLDKNVLLIIECKWQENVYNPTENYLNIQRIFNKVFKKQLPTHEKFLRRKENIDYIFDYDQRVVEKSNNVDIHYIMLDKRVQYHHGNKHLVTVYMMLLLINIYAQDDGILRLDELISKVESFETEVDYELLGSCTEFILDGDKVSAEYLNYYYLEP